MTKIITRASLAGALALVLAGAAQAQTIPTPVNPTPRFPVATDGTPLPRNNVDADSGLFSGRSAFAPLGGVVGGVVGSGLGVAGTAVGTGLGTANATVDGTAGAVGVR